MRDLATRLSHSPFPSPSRNPSRVYRAILLCYCSRARRDIPDSRSRLDIHVTLRCQHGLGLVGFFVEMQLDSSLSLSLENAQRMFDGFTGEEIWSGAVLRRGYTKGVMDACFREQAVGSGESELSNAIWRGNKILGRLDSLLRKFLGSRLDFWKFLSLKNANNSGWTRGGRILNFAMDVRGVVGWFIEN